MTKDKATPQAAEGKKAEAPPPEEVPEDLRNIDVSDGAALEKAYEKMVLSKTDPLHRQIDQAGERRKAVEETAALKEQELNQVTSEQQRRKIEGEALTRRLAEREERLKKLKDRMRTEAAARGDETSKAAADRLREIDRREMDIKRREAAIIDQETSVKVQMDELEERKRAMKQQAQMLEAERAEVEARFAKGEITAKERDKQLKSTGDQLTALSAEIRQRQDKLAEQELALQAQLEEARAIKQRQGEIEKQLRAEKDNLESKLKDLITIRDQAAARERSFVEVEQELQAEIGQLANAKTALAQHEEVLREDKDRLEAEIKESREAAQRMRESEEDARKKLVALEASLRTAVDEVGTLKVKLAEEAQKREVQEKEAAQRKTELERYERKLHEEIALRQKAERSFEEAKRGVAEAEAELQRQVARGAELEKQLQGGESRMVELEAALEAARGESMKLTKKMQAGEKELEVLKRSFEEQRKRRELGDGRIKELEEAVSTFEREVEANALKRNVMQEQLDKQEKERELLNQQLAKERETIRLQEGLSKRTQSALDEARAQVERETAVRAKVEDDTRKLGESLKALKVTADHNDTARQKAEADRLVKEGELNKALSHLRDEERRRQEAQLKVQEQMEELLHVRDALQQAERQRDQIQDTVEKQQRELGEVKVTMAKLQSTTGGDAQVSETVNRLAKELERSKLDKIEADKAVRAKDQALGEVQQQVDKERHRASELELKLRFMAEENEEIRLGLKKADARSDEAISLAKQAAAAVQTVVPGPLPPPGSEPKGPMPAPGSVAPQPAFPAPAPLPQAPRAHEPPSAQLAERMAVLSNQGADVSPLRRVEDAAAPATEKRPMVKGKISLPAELLNYLNKPNGRSIIINGKRRTGKSNLALGLAEALANSDEEVLLLLTHEPDKRLTDAYGWLAEKRAEDFALFGRHNTPDAILQPPTADYGAARQKLVEAVRAVRGDGSNALPRVLDRPRSFRINTERISRLLSLNPGMAEIINLYDAIERLLPNKVVIVMDRADSLARKYGIEYKSLIEVLQRDLVRGANCDLIIVQERDDQHSADKSVDGVIVMRDISRTEEFLGEIAIANLTDVVLRRPRALYRFDEGRMRMIESADVGSGMDAD